jgi:hypothetical protein
MTWNDRLAGDNEDQVVEEALRNFKASVDAWSEAAYDRPRTVRAVRYGWRSAAAWALGCVIAAASVSGAMYEHRHQQELAGIAAAKAARQKAAEAKLAAEQQTANIADQDLLATVDDDISRAVPAAMEPLAQLMDEKQTDENGTTRNVK